MGINKIQGGGYIFAALLGAVAGAVITALLTRAVPRTVKKIMQVVTTAMMGRMKEISGSIPDT